MKTSLTLWDFVIVFVIMLAVAAVAHFTMNYKLSPSKDGAGETLKPTIAFI